MSKITPATITTADSPFTIPAGVYGQIGSELNYISSGNGNEIFLPEHVGTNGTDVPTVITVNSTLGTATVKVSGSDLLLDGYLTETTVAVGTCKVFRSVQKGRWKVS